MTTLTLYANEDTNADESNGASPSGGTDTTIRVGGNAGFNLRVRSFFGFDLSTLPTNAVVSSATLNVNATALSGGGQTVTAHEITGAWTEAGLDWVDQPAVGSSYGSVAPATGWRQWTVTGAITAYKAGTVKGFRLIGTEGDNATVTFATRESANDPYLTIDYTLPSGQQMIL